MATERDHRLMHCPIDSSVLTEIVTTEATTAVCPSCRGVWLSRQLLSAVAESFRERGWTGYVHYAASSSTQGSCPACGGELDEYVTPSESVSRCRGCGALWIPPDVLLSESAGSARSARPPSEDEASRKEATVPEPRSIALLRDTADAAGVDPFILDDIVNSSWEAWLGA